MKITNLAQFALLTLLAGGCKPGLDDPFIYLTPNDAETSEVPSVDGGVEVDGDVIIMMTDSGLDAGNTTPDAEVVDSEAMDAFSDATTAMVDANEIVDAEESTDSEVRMDATPDAGQAEDVVVAADAVNTSMDAEPAEDARPDATTVMVDTGSDGGNTIPDTGPSCPGVPELLIATPSGAMDETYTSAATGRTVAEMSFSTDVQGVDILSLAVFFHNEDYNTNIFSGLVCGAVEGTFCFRNLRIENNGVTVCTSNGFTVQNGADREQLLGFSCPQLTVPPCGTVSVRIIADVYPPPTGTYSTFRITAPHTIPGSVTAMRQNGSPVTPILTNVLQYRYLAP